MNNFAIDPYIDHSDLEETLNKRETDGWTLVQIMPLKEKDGREYVSIMWRMAQKVQVPNLTLAR
jgi:hypothetical protein